MQADSTRPYQRIIHFNDTIEGDPGRLRLSQGASLKPDESESCSLVSSQRKVTGDGSGVEILNERVMEVWSRGGREMVAEWSCDRGARGTACSRKHRGGEQVRCTCNDENGIE